MADNEKAKDTLNRRAHALADKVLEWRRLAELHQYPKSLVEILAKALKHERALVARQSGGR